VDIARDFEVTWRDTDATFVEVNLSASEGRFRVIQPGQSEFVATRSTAVSCAFLASTGRGRISASLLRGFSPGATSEITPEVWNGTVDARLGSLAITPQTRTAVVAARPAGGFRVIDVTVAGSFPGTQVQRLTFR
jgi:hypothetical protein